jgi:HK97 gp10 family phage protein
MARSRQLQRVLKAFDAVPQAVREAVRPTLLKSGDELADMMKHLAPKDTGALAESITVTLPGGTTPAYSQPGGSKVVPLNAVMVTAGNADVRYPHLVEHGTATAHAQPFFWPSFRLLRKRIENRIKRAIGKVSSEAWVK